MKKILNATILFLLILFSVPSFSLNAQEVQKPENEWYELGAFRETTYYRTIKKWNQKYNAINLDNELEFDLGPSQALPQNAGLVFTFDDNYNYVELGKDKSLDFVVEVNQTGLYELGLLFKAADNYTSEPYVGFKINGEEPFNEISNIALEVFWTLEEREDEKRYNRYGNELLPYSKAKNEWVKHYLNDTNARFVHPYKVLLNQGVNIVTITNHSLDLKIAKLFLNNTKENITYENYIAKYKNEAVVEDILKLEAELMTEKNDIEIKAGYYKDPGMTPNAYKNSVLNMLDGSSSSRGGSKATYSFNVEKAGLYSISLKYLQNKLNGLSISKAIYIDGAIPFKEFESYLFPESKKWVNHTLNDNGDEYKVYLSKGRHTISLETTVIHYNDLIERLYVVMDKINTLGLTIASITGSSTNTFTDWNIVKYLPNIVNDLHAYADEITAVYEEINEMTGKEASEVSSLKVAAKQLRNLSKRPNKINLKLSQLNSGSGSAYQLVGTAIGILLMQPLDIDTIYLGGSHKTLPRANANIFRKFWFSIKSFFYSFVDERYKVAGSRREDVLEVWVAQSNLYIDIIQSMADTEFTPLYGKEVKINILPSTQKIILNNATNSNPDVVLSIDSWEPYNYALRGMLEDLSKYDGFDDVTQNMYANLFTPVIYDEGVYAIPETQGLNLLFYRKDIFEYLDIKPPKTWDDVIKILPILQSYQMNFYHPLGSESSYKNYSATTPFIYGHGGEVFTENGLTTVLTDENVINGIQFMTDLFNVYNLPLQVSSFFEHFRSGTLPVGVGTIDMYLQLKYASPELAGQWGISQVPGFDRNHDGEPESWTTAYGKSSILFKSSNMKQDGWNFIKWWNSTETQIEYLQNIKMSLGEKFLVIPANVDALEASNWDQEIKTQVGLAAKWSRIPAITPGSYIVEREFSNIWNLVVIDKMDVRVAVGKSIDVVNRELSRKFEEFGYVKNGVVIKEYIVPNNDNIERWVRGKKND
ncbi:MAG TPA: extracellular solute-binding protein [Acholeplasmataceae bacterium]|nr:extracellular solute-binding protein [Acholeplasmataceae bacterium]